MLYPQQNPFRQMIDLSGFWDLRFDPEHAGSAAGWSDGFEGGRPAAVPASWNEQFEDGRDYLGQTWYQTTFDLPWGWQADGQTIWLRFGSVNYVAEVWLNGTRLGSHEGGHLPFEFDVTAVAKDEGNRLVLLVEGELAPDRVPPGNLTDISQGFADNISYPAASFDFFPFCGIQRPVLLYTTPSDGIRDVTVVTEIEGTTGRVRVRVDRFGDSGARAFFWLEETTVNELTDFAQGPVDMILDVPDAKFWSPESPHLYTLNIQLIQAGSVVDLYRLSIGIRTIAVEGNQLLLNGQPIYLRGFGRHEDFPVMGRGYVPAVVVKDYALMEWIGANSFRTTHYPYSEAMMDLADRLGFLVIDETPAVGLFFDETGREKRLELCRQYTQDLIARDKNHPSVIMWSLANEPHSRHPEAKPFFRTLYDLAREADTSRPITVVSYVGVGEEAFEFVDVVCLNRYLGWYSHTAQLDAALPALSAELDALYERFHKPIIMTEFGADAIAGHHAQPPELFSEEYQAEMVERYIRLFRTKPFIIGEHVWNLADFKTSQSVRRVGSLNLKGVFTRDRRPKLVAHRLKALWGEEK